jgi:hypothetical protein
MGTMRPWKVLGRVLAPAIALCGLAPVVAFAYTVDPNVPAAIKQQLGDDLGFMGSIQGDTVSNLHLQIFSKMDGANYQNWFNSRVTAVGMNSCGSSNAVACVIPWMGSSKIWLTQNYIKFSHPQIARMMVVYHEARHTEVKNGNWPHATCPTPFLDKDGKEIKSIWTGATLAGEAACDETPFGSYGSSMILLKNVQKFCKTCTEKVHMDAGIYADDQFKRIIDPGAIDQITKDLYSSLE